MSKRNYSEQLMRIMPPELKRRIEKAAQQERITFEEKIVSFLKNGAITYSFYASGANISIAKCYP